MVLILLWVVVVILCVWVGWVSYFIIYAPHEKMGRDSKSLEELVMILRSREEEGIREKREKDMLGYGLKHMDIGNGKGIGGNIDNDISSYGIRVSNGDGSGPVRGGREYIPYNLTEREKGILREFNNNNNNS